MNNLKLVNVMIRTMIEEGNHLEAEYGGYKYEIKRVPHSGALCGYIYMDKATKEEYEILNHYFHCGVTWGDEEGSRHGKYGFDCNHSYDCHHIGCSLGFMKVKDMTLSSLENIETWSMWKGLSNKLLINSMKIN